MEIFEQEFESLYRSENGRPGKSIRLMVGLLMLKHIRNVSDENVVEQWSENNYCQYFCGEQSFVPGVPYEASELVHFRKRIGEKDDCKVKTIAGILARELERSLLPLSKHQNQLDLFKQVLIQIKSSKNKIYSIHEPEVCGISKGKEYKKYEFGNKASFAKTDSESLWEQWCLEMNVMVTPYRYNWNR
ncbi:MAG: transposase [Sphingobacteriales bacterium]|nr:transposase [Sphingobacteriales bacterium]